MAGIHDPHDPSISDHVVAETQLKEKIVNLQKTISLKEGQLLAKDRLVIYFNKFNYCEKIFIHH